MAKKKDCCPNSKISTGGGVYCLGLIGALVYYLQQASTFSAGLMGFLKALVWPAMLVYNLMKFLV